MKTIRYSIAADRALARMPTRQAAKIEAKIDQLAFAPESLVGNVKRLRGTSVFRLRVDDYRVLFDEDGIILDILDVGPRGGIYG